MNSLIKKNNISNNFLSKQNKKLSRWLYFTWFNFAVSYRKTFLGPLWIVVGPALFVTFLGLLFSRVNNTEVSTFIPHMAIGLIVWTLINGFVNNSTKVFQRNRAQILQGNMTLLDITIVEVLSTLLQFSHQLIVILAVFLLFGLSLNPYAFISFLGLLLLIINGLWLTIFFGIIGARYRDLPEIIAAIMRIAFLATPIIWMPGGSGLSDVGGRGAVVSSFLNFNPFYHFMELIRSPLLNQQISLISIGVVLTFTLLGSLLAYTFHKRFAKLIPLWV